VTSITVPIPLPVPWLSANVRRRLHHQALARHTRQQRHDAALCAYAALAGYPDALQRPLFPTGRVRLDVTVCPRPRQQRADDGAVIEAMKASIDGLEDAGIVANDSQIVFGSLTWSQERTSTILLTLTEVPDGA
jgi:Holliday junction resolvase RusA-like endonuclease